MKILVALFVLWLLPFVITSFYNQPAIDDWWNANAVNAYGKMDAVHHFYQTVSGRYFSLFIMSVCNTLPQGEVWIFKVFPIIILVLLFGSSYFFYTSFFTKKSAKTNAVLLSCLFVVCHIASMRSLFEGLYWMSSTVCYQLAICLFAISIGAIVRDARKPTSTTKTIAIASCLLLPGSVEMMVPVYCLTLVLLLYFSYKFHYAKSTIIVCLAITFILAIAVAISKGNLARIANNSTSYHPSLWVALWYCARSVGYYTAIYISNPLFVSAFLLLGLLHHSKIKMPFVVRGKDLIVVLGYFALSCFVVYLPLHLFESSIPFPRVTTLFLFLFFQACLIVAFYPSTRITRLVNNANIFLKIKTVKTTLLVVLVISAFTTKNFVLLCKDLFNGTTVKYNFESYQRYNIIRSCKGDTCFVPPYKHWAYFAQSSKDEVSDPNHFQHMNVYFKKTILFR